MFPSLWKRFDDGIEAVRQFISTNDDVRKFFNSIPQASEPTLAELEVSRIRDYSPSISQWSVMDHCATVGRLYALYEQFAESILSEWIQFRSQGLKYTELPAEFQKAYNEGFSIVLGALGETRYSHLSFESMVVAHNLALSGELNYRLFPECLTFHRNNLRLGELSEICKRCGIANLEQWIAASPDLGAHFGVERKIIEQSTSKLRQFVQYRNDAAHGGISTDEILGREELENHVDFIRAFCRALYQLVTDKSMEFLIEAQKAHQIGTITESFKHNRAVAIIEGTAITEGDRIFVRTDRVCEMNTVVSLQLDDTPQKTVTVATSKEVGLQFLNPVPKRAKLFVVIV